MDMALEPDAVDEITALLADGLLAHDNSAGDLARIVIDTKATRLMREYLAANINRTVTSEELEGITGQNRYRLTRQFRKAYGTSPYRYLTMRRLDKARADIVAGLSLVDAAMNAGFSDQAHMTRGFRASFGISPGYWQRLVRKHGRPT